MPTVKQKKDLVFFLLEGGYQVEEKDDDVFVVTCPLELVDGAPPFAMQIVIAGTDEELRFVADLCRKDQIKPDKLTDFMYKALDLNTDISPVAIAFDTIKEGDERAVLVQSLSVDDLDASEVLYTLDKFETAAIAAYEMTEDYLNK